MSSNRVSGPVLGTTGIVLFLLAWEAIPRLGIVNERFLPPASVVLNRLVNYLGQASFWKDVGETMLAWGLGLAISVVAAVALGLVIGSSRFLGGAASPCWAFSASASHSSPKRSNAASFAGTTA